jgi:putative SOS response-associated peptidase YedK
VRQNGETRRWSGDHGGGRHTKPILGPHLVHGFLTTTPNAVVEPIHPKAMPVILMTDDERDLWMRARHGMKRRRCSAPCPTMCSRL